MTLKKTLIFLVIIVCAVICSTVKFTSVTEVFKNNNFTVLLDAGHEGYELCFNK